MTQASPSTLRQDLIASYAAAGAKVGSWAVVSAVIYRAGGEGSLGLFAPIRATIGILNYTTLGLAPAMIREAARNLPAVRVIPIRVEETASEPEQVKPTHLINYAMPDLVKERPLAIVYSSSLLLSILLGVIGILLVAIYALNIDQLHEIADYFKFNETARQLAFLLGLGLLVRLLSDVQGTVLQVRGRLWIDQWLVAISDITWVVWVLLAVDFGDGSEVLVVAGRSYWVTGIGLLVCRTVLAFIHSDLGWSNLFSGRIAIARRLLAFGSLLTLAQLADFLYAPTDMILINRFVSPQAVAAYTPAIQIDAALLLLVAGLANVILPRAALAHAAGNVTQLRRDYVRGTLVSFTLLLVGAVAIWLASPVLFKIWFNDPLPAAQAVLPLVLIHTVVGGSSAVGRSILLGMGRVKPYTAAALLAGVSNVVLSYSFVRFFNLGLNGIVLGTIIVVVARCAIWMPWYVWRVLGKNDVTLDVDDDGTQATPIV